MNSSKPFEKCIFFLNLKDYPKEKKLIKDLELLGAKQELFLNKNVSFVVSDKVLKPEFKSPSAPFSVSKSVSLSPFKESPFNALNSPASTSSYMDQRSAMETFKPMSRAMSVLQKSKEKFRGGSKDVTEICKQWNIKIYPLKKVLSCIDKYKDKYYKEHFEKKKTAPSASAQKISPPFIKFEDSKRNYKPKYKTLKWPLMSDSPLLRSVNTITKNFKQSGDVFASRAVLKETKPPNLSWSSRNESFRTETAVSVTKAAGFNSISTAVSVCGSRTVKAEKENHSNCQKAKKDKLTKKEKRYYCEICNVHFTDTEAHYEKKAHLDYLNNSANYKEVEDIVFSLPQPEDFLARLQKKEEKEISDDNVQLLHDDLTEIDSSPSKENNIVPVQENKDDEGKTEDYSMNVDDYVSASRSTPSAALSFLEHAETTNARRQDSGPPILMCYAALENASNAYCSQNNLFPPSLIPCNLLDMIVEVPPASTAEGNHHCTTPTHCFATETSNYGTLQNINSSMTQLHYRPTGSSYHESGVYLSGEGPAETIGASPNLVDEANARCLNRSSWPDSYYQPVLNVPSMYTEMPLDLSLNCRKRRRINLNPDIVDYSCNIVNATNIPDINNSVTIVDDANGGSDSSTIIDVVSLSPKIVEVNHVDLANTIDASKMLEDNDSNAVMNITSVSNDDGAAQIIDINTISIGDSASALNEIKDSDNTIKVLDKMTFSIDDSASIIITSPANQNSANIVEMTKYSNGDDSASIINGKVSDDNTSTKTIDLVTISVADSADAINLTNLSEDNSMKIDLTSPENENSANIVEMTKYSNGDDLANIVNTKMLSNNFISNIKKPIPISPLLNSVSFVNQVGGLNKEDNFDEATENYPSSETDSDSDVHIMVSNCLNEIDKNLENDNVDASSVNLFQQNEVIELDTSKVESHAKGSDATHSSRIRVELFDTGVNEYSTKHVTLGTKRKYNSGHDCLSTDELQEMLTACNSCELSEKFQMNSPFKRSRFSDEKNNIVGISENASNIDMMSSFRSKLHEQNTLDSHVPSYLEEQGKKIYNIGSDVPMLIKQENSLKASLTEENPFTELIRSIRASKIPNEIPDSDDAYIILDEVVDDDGCSNSESSFELKIVGKDIGFSNVNINTKETGVIGDGDNLLNTNKSFVEVTSEEESKVNSDQKLSSIDITDNASETQEEEQSSNNVVYELMKCVLNDIEGKAEDHHKESSDSEEVLDSPLKLKKVCKMDDYKTYSDANIIREIQHKKLQVVIHKMGEDDLKKYGIQFSDNSNSVKYISSLNGSSSSEGNVSSSDESNVSSSDESNVSSSDESNVSFEDSPPQPSSQSGFDYTVADSVDMQSNQTLHIVYLNSLAPSNSSFLSGSGQMVPI